MTWTNTGVYSHNILLMLLRKFYGNIDLKDIILIEEMKIIYTIAIRRCQTFLLKCSQHTIYVTSFALILPSVLLRKNSCTCILLRFFFPRLYKYVVYAFSQVFALTMLNVRSSSILNGLDEKTHNRKSN